MSTFGYFHGTGLLQIALSDTQIVETEAALAGIRDGAGKAQRAAINDTLKWAKTRLKEKLFAVLHLRAGDIAKRIRITKRASEGGLEGVIQIDYEAVPLTEFKPAFRKAMGVRVKTLESQVPHVFKHQFRAVMGSGHVAAWERHPYEPKANPTQGRYTLAARQARAAARPGRKRHRKIRPVVGRQRLYEAYGPSVLVAFEETPGMIEDALKDIGAKLAERIDSKIAWQLEKGTPIAPEDSPAAAAA